MPLETVAHRRQRTTVSADKLRPLRLRGARVAVDAHSALPADLEIACGRIRNMVPRSKDGESRLSSDGDSVEVDLSGYMLLPGLINAHDHLEFSLFPKLGSGPYSSAGEWAEDIYHPHSSPIREHLLVPKPVRLWWGGIQNLLCGVTTVCHHNEFHADIFGAEFPVRVLQRYSWSHSLRFGADLKADFGAGDCGSPYIIHLGEGTDAAAAAEIFDLDRMGLLNERTVIVHGVALHEAGHDLLIRRGASLIWCPGSNLFMFGATLSPQKIARHPRAALGSDSALTAGNLLDQLHIAHELGLLDEQVFALVTGGAARILRLQDGEGRLCPGAIADMIAIPDGGLSPGATLRQFEMTDVELVLLAGAPQLLSDEMTSRFPEPLCHELEAIVVSGLRRYVRAPVAYLLEEARKHLGAGLKLCGARLGQ